MGRDTRLVQEGNAQFTPSTGSSLMGSIVTESSPRNGKKRVHAYAAIVSAPENGMMRCARCGIERVIVRLGTPILLHAR